MMPGKFSEDFATGQMLRHQLGWTITRGRISGGNVLL
jgi:hypothetical protein